ncbi:uncharacterized protein LOC125817205 [Solanum verrucosum]|uniref:uncharacterized protein LOC125817205 n=1 Tax=Solanum verrucosum TaxID=315347 RepID=UPI0020D06C9B|nr:uncharacterized protein LOC125817205 [Solanum verrucosum]
MVVAEFVVAGGDYMGVWKETPKSRNWKSLSKTTVPIALRRNGSYDDLIASVIEAGELTSEPNDLVIMVNKDSNRFMYYILAFGACIRGFAHMRKVIAIDGTHLHSKYEGELLRDVAQYTENHVYPIFFCIVDKENDASWTFFFEKLKEIVVDKPDLCFISNRHKSIANGIVNSYNYAHHGYCRRHLNESLHVNHHCGDSLYLYYNVAKAYSLKEFYNHFVEFKNKFPAAIVVLEHDIGFEKWSRVHFPGNRYDVMTKNITESLNAMLIDEREYPVASIKQLYCQ